MTDHLKAVLEDCWSEGGDPDTSTKEQSCRWCHQSQRHGHAPDCPCLALSLALQHRDALANYVKAEKRNLIMQGALRLAKKSAKDDVKRRRDEAAMLLEDVLTRLRELGIEDMVR
ncbi:MAG: hypothetical protein PVF70_13530 [Anaerolineales bacterium]